jgi:hypothetical protein
LPFVNTSSTEIVPVKAKLNVNTTLDPATTTDATLELTSAPEAENAFNRDADAGGDTNITVADRDAPSPTMDSKKGNAVMFAIIRYTPS